MIVIPDLYPTIQRRAHFAHLKNEDVSCLIVLHKDANKSIECYWPDVKK